MFSYQYLAALYLFDIAKIHQIAYVTTRKVSFFQLFLIFRKGSPDLDFFRICIKVQVVGEYLNILHFIRRNFFAALFCFQMQLYSVLYIGKYPQRSGQLAAERL